MDNKTYVELKIIIRGVDYTYEEAELVWQELNKIFYSAPVYINPQTTPNWPWNYPTITSETKP
jgi:hypothetical protein